VKPNNSFPPFDFDAVPMWLEPRLWNENIDLKLRWLRFLVLYTISTLVNMLLVFGPVAVFLGTKDLLITSCLWLITSLPGGLILGLCAWRDFSKRVYLEQLQK
jgi:hypothetical protein